jgi:glycosyltransferase involved in cell wall biosynthesis
MQRVFFNATAAAQLRANPVDLVIGFDLDGFLLNDRQAPRRVAAIKGIIADELRYEQWAIRLSLGTQALCEKIHVRRVPLVLVTSAFARQRLTHHYGVPAERIRIVPEPIDLDGWQELYAASPRRDAAELPILCVAHMYPRKSIGTLITALSYLRPHYPQLRLRLVGHGPEEGHLRLLVKRLGLEQVVHFLGHISRADLAREYRQAAIFCLPSRQEGFGIVYLEAMAAGLPIVACAAAAVPEVVSDGEVGLLVPPVNPSALAGALAQLAEDADLRQRLGAAGVARVQRYRPERIREIFLRTLAEERLLHEFQSDRLAAAG